MANNEFILPNELGWKANDEIRERLLQFVSDLTQRVNDGATDENGEEAFQNTAKGIEQVVAAECMDDIYAIIKKYQGEKANG